MEIGTINVKEKSSHNIMIPYYFKYLIKNYCKW